MRMQSSLFECTVFHRRETPAVHAFTSRVFMWLLDLDEIDALCDQLPLLSRNSHNIYSFRDSDHLYRGQPSLRANIEAYLKEEGVSTHPERIELLTNLRTFGYVFNPVSFFYCYDADEVPFAVVVEVHNTYGELKPFLLTRDDLLKQGFRKETPKLFYISPFSELDHQLRIRTELPADRLAIHVDSFRETEDKPFFRSSLTGKAVPLTTTALARYTLRFPFITLKVISLIHWHALRLYLKKVPVNRKSAHPELQQGILPKRHQSL
jgi:DUF1365 family protein